MKVNRFISWCRRYIRWPFLVGVAVIVFLTFFNENNVQRYYEYDLEIERLKKEIKNHEDTITYYRQLNSKLSTDRETLERIVREQYHMQRRDEDVYVFTKD